jgi:hypothetical protein
MERGTGSVEWILLGVRVDNVNQGRGMDWNDVLRVCYVRDVLSFGVHSRFDIGCFCIHIVPYCSALEILG